MEFFIYNTLTRKKEKFEPYYDFNKKDFVGIYTCGPTVYSDPHLWNLRAFVFAWLLGDFIRNVLQYPTKHVLNITDVGHLTDDGDAWQDKMEKWAQKEWTTAWEIAKKYENNFKQYIKQLQLNFDHFPKATENIQEQIDIIQQLQNKSLTYEIPWDWIYMDTSNIKDYGKLMWKNYEKHIQWLKEWARVDTEGKKNPTDFSLWKFSPKWQKRHMERDSPWWMWFPGWHIECSAMSRKYLWDFFDIHTGGPDHINTHHTNEIAQSECSFAPTPWVKYWIHNQFLNISWDKISKSAWDTLSLPDVIKKWYSPHDLRYFYLTWHYRSFLNFDWLAISKASKTRQNIIKKLLKNKHINSINTSWLSFAELENKLNHSKSKEFLQEITAPLLDDLKTPKVLSVINTKINDLNYEWLEILSWFDENLLKIGLFAEIKNIRNQSKKAQIPYYIQQLAQERRKARSEKNFEKADELRDKLYQQWYVVKDLKDTYILQHKIDTNK